MSPIKGNVLPSDALVLFGITGDLAYKMTFPALYAMAKRGDLRAPLIGVASSKWTVAQLHKHATDSIRKSGGIDDRSALRHLLSLLTYVDGDYNDPATFKALKGALGAAKRPAWAARVKRAGKEFVGDQQELYLSDEQPGEEAPYERLLGAAMAGDGALFTREDAVEAAWAVVDPVLKNHRPVRPYRRHSWGPKEADALIATDGDWHNPTPDKERK